MRNKVNLIIILVCLILLFFVIFNGINIGNVELLSTSQLKEKNDNLDAEIAKVSALTSIDYPKNVETLEETFEKYIIEKDKYEELSGGSAKDIKDIYETKQYDISYLWRVIGNYATNRSLIMGIEVKKSSSLNNLYNFNFTVSGEYVNIIKFIMDIEDDSELYFRIHNFKMSGNSKITAKFTIKNISIDESTIKNTTSDLLSEK